MQSVSYPQSLVKINGQPITFVSWNVENNISSTADTFDIVIAKQTLETGNLTNAYLFRTEDDIFVEVYLGFSDTPKALTEKDMKLLINGYVDGVDWEFDQDSVKIKGRDKTALFLDSETSDKFTNLTVEDVIRLMARGKGLSVQISSDVAGHTKKVGTVANGEQSLMAEKTTQWDLLVSLAKEEGRDLFVKGNSLIYRNIVEPYKRSPLSFTWGKDLTKFQIGRVLKNRKNRIAVTVRSWNTNTNQVHTYTAIAGTDVGRAKPTKRNHSHSKPAAEQYDNEYVINIPNLSAADVKIRAITLARDINKHELNTTFEVPAEKAHDLDTVVYLDNVPIPGKQYFIPKRLTTAFSTGGVTSNFECVNHVLPVKGSSNE